MEVWDDEKIEIEEHFSFLGESFYASSVLPSNMVHIIWPYNMDNMIWTILYEPYDMVNIIWFLCHFLFNFSMSISFILMYFKTSHHMNLVGLDLESFDMSKLDEIEREWIFPFSVAHSILKSSVLYFWRLFWTVQYGPYDMVQSAVHYDLQYLTVPTDVRK